MNRDTDADDTTMNHNDESGTIPEYECPECGIVFNNSQDYDQHLQSRH